jgi:hypothetical protein
LVEVAMKRGEVDGQMGQRNCRSHEQGQQWLCLLWKNNSWWDAKDREKDGSGQGLSGLDTAMSMQNSSMLYLSSGADA